jgi:cob(I)alamin adenosyltransferase
MTAKECAIGAKTGPKWRNAADRAQDVSYRIGSRGALFLPGNRPVRSVLKRRAEPAARRAKGSAMPKLTRIYTRTGDRGETGLVGGQRVKKNALRIETYGTVDELSSSIGLARTALAALDARAGEAARERARRLDAWLAWTQDVLFNLGSDLATLPKDRWPGMPLVAASDAEALERAIDLAQLDLEPLANFILPGGSYPGAFLHLARTVARRAERLLFTLAESEEISEDPLRYLNRLSDALFVWSRWINNALAQPEAQWTSTTSPPDV